MASNSSSIAGPSNPIRRNPVKLTVAQRSLNGTNPVVQDDNVNGSEYIGEEDRLLKAAVRKAQLQKRIDRWMDKLMEETVDRATFKKIVSHLTPSQYQETIHERHLNSICSYPLCSNKPRREYSTSKRFVISTSNRTIKEKMGNEEDGFCDKKCEKKSGWVLRNLSDQAIWLKSNIEEFDLIEDLEDKGQFSWNENKPERSKTRSDTKRDNQIKDKSNVESSATSTRDQPKDGSSKLIKNDTTTASPSTNNLPSSASIENPVTALIASLTIHERPTPSTPPIAPSLSTPVSSTLSPQPSSSHNSTQSPSHAQPQPSSSKVNTPSKDKNTNSNSPRETRRNAQSSLMGSSTSGLSNTIVTASKISSIGISQEEESEEENEKEESDWEKEMGWGDEDDEELKGFWEEARLAQELLDEDKVV